MDIQGREGQKKNRGVKMGIFDFLKGKKKEAVEVEPLPLPKGSGFAPGQASKKFVPYPDAPKPVEPPTEKKNEETIKPKKRKTTPAKKIEKESATFLALDLETPNLKNDAICSMGLTLVENGEIQYSREILINPQVRFDLKNMTIHGITLEKVKDAPTLAEAWEEWGPIIQRYPIVAHNAAFDMSVLAKAARAEGIEIAPQNIYCTLELCRDHLNYEAVALDDVCRRLEIELDHHNSASDSLAAAKIMLHLLSEEQWEDGVPICFTPRQFAYRAKNKWSATKPTGAERTIKTGISIHLEGDNMIVEAGKIDQASKAQSEIVMPECDYSDADILFEGKRFVFTGAFPGVPRSEAQKIVEAKGGKVTTTVSKKTDYVIIGLEDTAVVGADTKSAKIEKAEELNASGCSIQLIKAEKFIQAAKK